MKLSEKSRIILPIAMIGIFVFSSFAWIYYFNNHQLRQIIEEERLLDEISGDIKEFNRTIQSGILTLDETYEIRSANFSLRVFERLELLQKTHSDEAERLRRMHIDYYTKLVSISSLFLEKRLEEGRSNLSALERSYSGINQEIEGMIEAHIKEYRGAVRNINFFMFTTSIVFTLMISLIVYLFMYYSRKRREAEAALIEAEKMASIGSFATGVAHEIRNPLTIILQGIEYLKSSLSGEARLIAVADDTKQAALRVDRVVKGLISVTQKAPEVPEYLDIAAAIEETLFLLEQEMNLKGIKAEKRFTGQACKVRCDGIKMRQAFANILLNSIEAMDKGGTISVSLQELTPGRLQIEFIDTGPGIPEMERSKVLDPFFSTKKGNGHAGLGLSVARGIIEASNGTIRIGGKTGKGAVVNIILPCS